MWEESSEKPRALRTGLTTGTCATACSIAAARQLLGFLANLGSAAKADSNPEKISSDHPLLTDIISVTLPKGQTVELTVEADFADPSSCPKPTLITADGRIARASTIKDAGDDPDVTHGARVYVDIQLQQQPAIEFLAAEGVGTVTRAGLALAVGDAAINPVPRQMITEHLTDLAKEFQYQGGFRVAVGIEGGADIALKTMNPRLGIVGGLSILGTSGIVRPFSCAAWIASIHQAIDVARSNQLTHLAASTGNASEIAIRQKYQLSDMALIEMGDFVGAVLKHLKRHPVDKLSISGGFGKISKLAMGHMDLHSRASNIDFEHIAEIAKQAGAEASLLEQIRNANTSIEALNLCQQQQVPLAEAMCRSAWQVCRKKLPQAIDLEIWAINRRGEFVGFSQGQSLADYRNQPL